MQRGQNNISTGFNIPWIGGSIYHWQGVKIPCVVEPWVKGPIYHMHSGQNTMGKEFDILWVGGQNTMRRESDIPWVGDSKYHVQGSTDHGQGFIYHGQGARYIIGTGVKIQWLRVQYAMDRGFDIPWVGGQNTMVGRSMYHGQRVRYPMGRGLNIHNVPWVGVENTMGRGVKISWVEDVIYHIQRSQNTMGKGFNTVYHEQMVRYTMNRGFKIPWIGKSKYHGQRVLYTIARGYYRPWVVGQKTLLCVQNTIDRGVIYHGQGSKYHGQE